jgi:RimJ/RimL family protein N-acetyltransferase
VVEPLRLITDRLVLEPFEPARDWAAFVEGIVLDPAVTRDWGEHQDPALTDADRERRAADEYLPWFEDGRARGLVAWTMRTHDGQFVGVGGLLVAGAPLGDEDPEFGCLLAARWHGRGLATEAGQAILDDGWTRLGLARVVTVLDTPNPASRRLVDKLGFRFADVLFDEVGHPYVVLAIDAS